MKQLRARLLNGDVILGQMILELFTPGIGPMLAAAGLHFVSNMEDGPCDIAQIGELLPRVAEAILRHGYESQTFTSVLCREFLI